jgi:hypothetical protein
MIRGLISRANGEEGNVLFPYGPSDKGNAAVYRRLAEG